MAPSAFSRNVIAMYENPYPAIPFRAARAGYVRARQ